MQVLRICAQKFVILPEWKVHMKTQNRISPTVKALRGIVLLAVLFSMIQAQPASAQVTGQGLEICLLPGTVQLKQDESQALKSALRKADAEVEFNGAVCFAPIELREEGEWMFITLAGLTNKPGGAWTISEDAVWSDNAIIRKTPGGMLASVAGTKAFSAALSSVPESIVPLEAKRVIDPLSAYSPSPHAGAAFQFPFEAGYQVYYGTKGGGVHTGEFSTVLGGTSMAVDLMSDGITASNHAPNRLLAVAPGTVVKKCSDATKNSTYLIIDDGTDKFLYAHIRSSTAPPLWAVVNVAGTILGELVPGSFSDGYCGYANQTAGFFHVHLEFLNRSSLTLSDWTLDTATEKWQRGAEVWSAGEWKQVGGSVTGCSQVSYTGVILYENANCNVETAGAMKAFPAAITWTDIAVADPIQNKASSIFVSSGWSAKVFEKSIAEGGGSWRCVTDRLSDLSTSYYTNGDTSRKMNDDISSIQVYADGNCGSGGTSDWTALYFNGHDHWLDTSNFNNQMCQETITSSGLDKNYTSSAPCNNGVANDWVAEYNTTVNFASGNYVFKAENDDGLKLWVNGVSVLDRSAAQGLSYACPARSLSGNVPIRAILNEETGDARIKIAWTTDVNVCNLPGAFGKVGPVNGATAQPNNPTLSWNASVDATEYFYCIDTSNDTVCDTGWQSVGNVTSQAISGLAVDKTYYWQIRANSAGGETFADGNTWWSFKTQPSNMLINPGFEDGTTTPTAWNKDAFVLANSTFEWSIDFFHSGSRSVKIISATANDARWTQTVTVQPNTDYKLSGWILTNDVAHTAETNDAGANLSILDGTVNHSTPSLFGDNPWTFVSLTFNSGANTQVTVAARLGMATGSTTGTAWFDDLKLEPATSAPTFGDVPLDHPQYAYIQALWDNGYTAGCSTDPLLFCPDTILDRAQSAVFMLRGQLGSTYAPPAAPWNTFGDDWTGFEWAEPWAEGMWQEGLTQGCQASPLLYCPSTQLPRVEASVFGLRMKYGVNYTPPTATGTLFADFPSTDPSYWAIDWAEQAYLDGLLPACGTDSVSGKPMFCPSQLVDRGWGAYLIVQAKGLLPTP